MTGVWPRATARLLDDPVFGPLVERVGPVRLRPSRGAPFESLAAAIVYQQLAGRAALTIHGRFVAALDGEVRPDTVLAATDETLRTAGLSRNKIAALRDLAGKVASGVVELAELDTLSDDDVVASLTRVRGIGAWTAHMYLIFDLQRPDVWPIGDLGVRAGLARLLGRDTTILPQEMELIGVGYRPWRSAVAWYCWRAVETITPG
ncbi:MAG: DNA-3-methyladenine glycosylase family protein [Longimicrobiales bacterium]